jgi:DNA-binding transcriptional MerR regulator
MIKLNDYVKVAEAAKMLGVSQNTLRKWADLGLIPVRIMPTSGYRLFRPKDLELFLRKTAKPAPARRRAK